MLTNTKARHELLDVRRMEEAAVTGGRSAEALFGYLSRLDALQAAQLSREALADRAFEAELHMRVVLSASMDALNELNDLGMLRSSPNEEEIKHFNETKLGDAVRQMARALRQHLPGQRWDWLDEASRLVEGVEMHVERHKEGYRGTVTHNRRTTVVHLDPAAPATRVSARAFFSDGPERIYTPTSAIFSPIEHEPEPVSGYDAVVGGLTFAREWVYRHARYAAEMGPPARSGGGPVVAVIAVVLLVAAGVALAVAAVLTIPCALGNDDMCRLASYLSLAGMILGGSGKYADDKARQMQYGTNQQ